MLKGHDNVIGHGGEKLDHDSSDQKASTLSYAEHARVYDGSIVTANSSACGLAVPPDEANKSTTTKNSVVSVSETERELGSKSTGASVSMQVVSNTASWSEENRLTREVPKKNSAVVDNLASTKELTHKSDEQLPSPNNLISVQHRAQHQSTHSTTVPILSQSISQSIPKELQHAQAYQQDRPKALGTVLPTEPLISHQGHNYSHQKLLQPLGNSQPSEILHQQNPVPPPPIKNTAQPMKSSIPTLSGSPDNNFDSILNSPQTKDEIVEKSPGGRYLRFLEKLGSGAYKDVYRAYDTIEGIEVAWNVVNLSGVPKLERQYIVNEVRLLEKLNHSNIISFHGSWVNRELEQVIFVTEILSSGTLKSFINKVQVIRWKIAKRWAIQILKGLEYLHSQDPPIIHRDLKCDNIFINGTSGDLRIGDLGLSTVMSNKGTLSVLGTPEFMAPDIYDETYDQQIDIYAFGMCMLEIFTKELPYRECSNPAQIYKKVTLGIEPKSLSRLQNLNARDFIRQCLGRSDGRGGFSRPTATELLSHPFLAKKSDDDSEVEVDPQLIERLPPETVPYTSGEGWKNLNDSLPTENDFIIRDGQEPSPSSSNIDTEKIGGGNIHSEDDAMKRNTNQETISKMSPNIFQEGPIHRSGSSGENTKSSAVEGSHTSVEVENATRDSSQKYLITEQVRNHHYHPIPVEQDIKAISTQIGTPIFDDINGSNLNGNGRLLDRDFIQDHGLSKESSPDEFVGMPDSETNIKKVKVLMGRGKEIGQEDDLPLPATTSKINERMSVATHLTMGGNRRSSREGFISGGQQYLTEATIIEDINVEYPFADDKMTVSMTLSVEPNFVQFDFDLIVDDPVQVAREMVTDLNITEDAVLQISEYISALARSARMQQKSSTRYQQIRQDELQPSSVTDEKSKASSKIVSEHVCHSNGNNFMENSNGIAAGQTESHHAMNPNDVLAKPYHQIGETTTSTIVSFESDDDDSCSSEYMQLKKDYENKVKRTKKAFDTRMENLHRSREEKEAQHLKTLERHEKEKVALEKRVKQAEKEQNQRLLLIQEEWERKCAHTKKLKVPQNSELPPLPPHAEQDKDFKMSIAASEINYLSTTNPVSLKSSAVDKSFAKTSSVSTTLSIEGSSSDKSQ